jgi:hypothetical protein
MVAVAAVLPASRRFFADRRVADVGRGEAAYDLTVRIPLATALAEELLFRGALLALFRQRRSEAAAVLWSSLLFGAWHVLPTLDDYQGNPASELIADPRRGRRLAVLATALSTAGAGVVFARLRLRSLQRPRPRPGARGGQPVGLPGRAARGQPPCSGWVTHSRDSSLVHRALVLTAHLWRGRLDAGP